MWKCICKVFWIRCTAILHSFRLECIMIWWWRTPLKCRYAVRWMDVLPRYCHCYLNSWCEYLWFYRFCWRIDCIFILMENSWMVSMRVLIQMVRDKILVRRQPFPFEITFFKPWLSSPGSSFSIFTKWEQHLIGKTQYPTSLHQCEVNAFESAMYQLSRLNGNLLNPFSLLQTAEGWFYDGPMTFSKSVRKPYNLSFPEDTAVSKQTTKNISNFHLILQTNFPHPSFQVHIGRCWKSKFTEFEYSRKKFKEYMSGKWKWRFEQKIFPFSNTYYLQYMNAGNSI